MPQNMSKPVFDFNSSHFVSKAEVVCRSNFNLSYFVSKAEVVCCFNTDIMFADDDLPVTSILTSPTCVFLPYNLIHNHVIF